LADAVARVGRGRADVSDGYRTGRDDSRVVTVPAGSDAAARTLTPPWHGGRARKRSFDARSRCGTTGVGSVRDTLSDRDHVGGTDAAYLCGWWTDGESISWWVSPGSREISDSVTDESAADTVTNPISEPVGLVENADRNHDRVRDIDRDADRASDRDKHAAADVRDYSVGPNSLDRDADAQSIADAARNGSQPAVADAGMDRNSHPGRHTWTDADFNGYANAHVHWHSDDHSDINPVGYPHPDSNGYTNQYANRHSDPNANRHRHLDEHADPNSDGYPDQYTDSNTDQYLYANSNGYSDFYTDWYTDRDINADPNPDDGIGSLCVGSKRLQSTWWRDNSEPNHTDCGGGWINEHQKCCLRVLTYTRTSGRWDGMGMGI
jgi:hypothetical protein